MILGIAFTSDGFSSAAVCCLYFVCILIIGLFENRYNFE
jgi:hypothetical protein